MMQESWWPESSWAKLALILAHWWKDIVLVRLLPLSCVSLSMCYITQELVCSTDMNKHVLGFLLYDFVFLLGGGDLHSELHRCTYDWYHLVHHLRLGDLLWGRVSDIAVFEQSVEVLRTAGDFQRSCSAHTVKVGTQHLLAKTLSSRCLDQRCQFQVVLDQWKGLPGARLTYSTRKALQEDGGCCCVMPDEMLWLLMAGAWNELVIPSKKKKMAISRTLQLSLWLCSFVGLP